MNKIYRTVWSDGYTATVVHTAEGYFKLMGNKRLFNTIEELEAYYKGTIKSIELETTFEEYNGEN